MRPLLTLLFWKLIRVGRVSALAVTLKRIGGLMASRSSDRGLRRGKGAQVFHADP